MIELITGSVIMLIGILVGFSMGRATTETKGK